jgi:hypothetical protein
MLVVADDGVGGAWSTPSFWSCLVSNIVPFYQVIAPANRAHEWSAAPCSIVVRYCSTCLHGLKAMMMPVAHTSCRHLGNMRVSWEHASLVGCHFSYAFLYFYSPQPTEGHGTHVSTGALQDGEAGSYSK